MLNRHHQCYPVHRNSKYSIDIWWWKYWIIHGLCSLFWILKKEFLNFLFHAEIYSHLLWISMLMVPGKHLRFFPFLKHLFLCSIHSCPSATTLAEALAHDLKMWHSFPPLQNPLRLIEAYGSFFFFWIIFNGPHYAYASWASLAVFLSIVPLLFWMCRQVPWWFGWNVCVPFQIHVNS